MSRMTKKVVRAGKNFKQVTVKEPGKQVKEQRPTLPANKVYELKKNKDPKHKGRLFDY